MNLKSKTNILINPNAVRINQKLSLRKQQNSKRIISQIVDKCINQSVHSFEFDEGSFISITREVKERILTISYQEILDVCKDIQKCKEILFCWISTMRKTSLSGDKELIRKELLPNLSNEKVIFILNAMVHSINGLTTEEEIKLRYETCCVLINLLIDTDQYNDIFIKKFEDIYNYANMIIKGELDNKANVLLYHVEWLISNIIEDSNIYAKIKENYKINIPNMILLIFQINTMNEPNLTQTNLWTLNQFLYNIDIGIFIQYKLFISHINDIMNVFIYNLNASLLDECFHTLSIFSNSPECSNFILNDNNLSIINNCIKFYELSTYSQKLMSKLASKDKHSILMQKYQIIPKLIIPTIQQIDSIENDTIVDKDKEKMQNILTLCSEVITNSSSPINTFHFNNQMFIQNIQKLYSLGDVKLNKYILLFYQSVFKKGDITFRAHLCKIQLHIFLINELKKYYDIKPINHIIKETIIIILTVIGLILKFSEETTDKINFIQKEMEDADIIDLLMNLQYFQSENIYSIAINLLENYWSFDDY